MEGETRVILDVHRPVQNSSQPLCFFWTGDIVAAHEHLSTLGAEILGPQAVLTRPAARLASRPAPLRQPIAPAAPEDVLDGHGRVARYVYLDGHIRNGEAAKDADDEGERPGDPYEALG
jgi:hypothetical protein